MGVNLQDHALGAVVQIDLGSGHLQGGGGAGNAIAKVTRLIY